MSSRLVNRALVGAILLFAVPHPALAGGVRIVEAPGLGSLHELQDAVDAAAAGDTLLVGEGTYGPVVVDGKGLKLFAFPGATVEIAGTLEVRNLPADELFVAAGIRATGAVAEYFSDPGLRLLDNAGHVRFLDCAFTGGEGAYGYYPGGSGGPGATLTGNPRVVFVRCTLAGGVGYSSGYQCYDCYGGGGGNYFVQRAGSGASTPTNIVCDGCTLGPNHPNNVNLGTSSGAGARNSIICEPMSGRSPFMTDSGASSVVNENNTVVPSDDSRCP